MHIPDGYLSPQTTLPALAVMVGIWSVALVKVKQTLRRRQVPLLALAAAFSYVIMLFNVPIPGGTTGHAVGAVLVAILLGPWAAVVAVSLALIVQALLHGDGGIMAIGANCFNMAVVMPFVGWGAYRLLAGSTPAGSFRQRLGGAVGGWLGLTAAAVFAGIEFGIQPLIAHDAAGIPLYCPFTLRQAVPAMALSHLLAFGILEGLVTAAVIGYFQRTAPELLSPDHSLAPRLSAARLAAALGVLVLLAPLGLYLPATFHAGAAWGEWSGSEVKAIIAREHGGRGYIPQGLQQAEKRGWQAPLPDYALPGRESAPLPAASLNYLLAGAIGMIVVGCLLLLGQRVLTRKDVADEPPAVDA